MTTGVNDRVVPMTTGRVLHWAFRYDLLLLLLMRGREHAYREKMLDLIALQAGDSVLDVGCGTGTLAIAAKQRVGQSGRVYGVDASPEMITRAAKKAKKAGAEIVFQNALAESLPFPDGQFDFVTTTVMLHHLPRKPRQQCISEIRRVLKPGGRILAIDFDGSSRKNRGLLGHLHRRHGHVKPEDLRSLISEAGFQRIDSGPAGISDLHFVVAETPTRLANTAPSSEGSNP